MNYIHHTERIIERRLPPESNNDIHSCIDQYQGMLLDVSAAFDTVYYDI